MFSKAYKYVAWLTADGGMMNFLSKLTGAFLSKTQSISLSTQISIFL